MLYTSYLYSVLFYKNPSRVCDVSERFACKGKQNKTCIYTTDCMLLLKQCLLCWKLCIYSVRPFVCLWLFFSHCTRCADMPCSFDIYSGVISDSLPLKSLIFCFFLFFIFAFIWCFIQDLLLVQDVYINVNDHVNVYFNFMMQFNSM